MGNNKEFSGGEKWFKFNVINGDIINSRLSMKFCVIYDTRREKTIKQLLKIIEIRDYLWNFEFRIILETS